MSDSTTHTIVPTAPPVPAASPALRQAPLAHVPTFRTYHVEKAAPLAFVVAMVVELLLLFLTVVFPPAVIAYIVAVARLRRPDTVDIREAKQESRLGNYGKSGREVRRVMLISFDSENIQLNPLLSLSLQSGSGNIITK
jgi:hypothetical protein